MQAKSSEGFNVKNFLSKIILNKTMHLRIFFILVGFQKDAVSRRYDIWCHRFALKWQP